LPDLGPDGLADFRRLFRITLGSSITRSSMERTNVTPQAFKACKSDGARK
jgi:hypothetical protein